MSNKKTLIIVSLIAVVNALGYGIIIPLIYAYGRKFGLSDFQNGLLIATFSLCQFLATPVLGKLSDAYGRKKILAISLAGSAVSFVMLAFAPSALILFLARALDGLTAGTIPVIQAVISDTTDVKNRTKGFGIIGAAFGFGFVFGPAISGFTVGMGVAVPFLIAAIVASLAVILTILVLPETNKTPKAIRGQKIFNFRGILRAAGDPSIGLTLILVLFYNLAFNLFTYAFQPYAINVLGVGVREIAQNLTLIGLVGIISQSVIIPLAIRKVGERKALVAALAGAGLILVILSATKTYLIFLILSLVHALFAGFVIPIVQTFLSREADEKSQGTIMGLSASYASIGMILGPVIGGLLVTLKDLLGIFSAGMITLFSVFLTRMLINRKLRHQML
jgi:MFS family permease